MKTVPVGNSATDPEAGAREERWFLIRLGVLFATIVVAILLVLALRNRERFAPAMRIKLEDGTWLVVRAITVGRNHSIEIPYPIDVRVKSGNRSFVKSVNTPTDRMMIWLTHEDNKGQFLDLGWFARCEVMPADGEIVRPNEYRLQRGQPFSNAETTAGAVGFVNAMRFHSQNAALRMALVHFDLPLVRPREGKLRLVVYDGMQSAIAQLDLPYPDLPNVSTEKWQPDPLPATRTDGNVDVKLTSVKFVNYHDDRRTVVDPQLEFTHDGQASNTWTATYQLQDLLGNISGAAKCDLSPHEPAWKLRLTMFQTTSGRFLPEETLKLPARTLIPAKQFLPLSESYTVNQTAVTLVGLGGQGPMEFNLPGMTTRFRTHRYQRRQADADVTIDCSGPRCDVEFSSGHAFLITRNVAGSTQMNIQFVIRDQSGEVLPQRGKSEAEGLDFVFFEPLPKSTSFEIEMIAQKCRHAEFLIQPPKPEINPRSP